MSTHPTFWNDNPSLLPFLPVLYVAWSDGELTADEFSALRTHAAKAIGEEALGAELSGWLNPDTPPGPERLHAMLDAIQSGADALEAPERMSLVELGLEMARHSDTQVLDWVNETTRGALTDLERALGVVGVEASRQILEPITPSRSEEATEAARFDIDAMTRVLDGDLTDIRHKVRALLSQGGFEVVTELDKDAYREQVKDWLLELARQHLGELAYPETLQRSEDLADFIAAFETLATFDLSLTVKFGVQFGLFGGSIYFLGTQEQRERYLPRIARGELLGCFAMTELGHGSNVRDLETSATYDPETETFLIHTPSEGARKEYIGNAACHGELATVFAQLIVDGASYGVHALLVPIRDESGAPMPGVRIADCGHKMGLNGVDNGRLWFDSVRVPREALLGRFAHVTEDGHYESPIPGESKRFFTMLGTLVGGRVSVACASLSVAQTALTIATRYGARRRQFGPAGAAEIAILDYRAHQRRLMPLIAKAYGLRFALDHLVRSFVESGSEEDTRHIEYMAAGLKAKASWFATEAVQTSRECCGGQGYMSANRFTALKGDVDIFATFEGDNVVLLQLVAKGLLTDFKRQFQSMNFFSMLRFISDTATNALSERNPIITRRTSSEHLRDPDYHLAVFASRRDDLLRSVAQRLKKRIDDGVDSFRAFNEVQNHIVDLASAAMDHLILEQFVAATRAVEDDALRSALDTVCALYGLYTMQDDIGWFLENDYVESGKAKAIRREVEALCEEVRAQAVPLVEAFGIPDACIAAPIALGDTIQ